MSGWLQHVRRQWFLVGLAILIPGGLSLGYALPAADLKPWTDRFPARPVTATVLFLMAWTLNSQHLKDSFRHPWPVLWACAVNSIAIPLIAIALRPLQTSEDYAIGLMIAASVPCTMAAASVWTRKAGGNDAVSLLVTVLTNGLCFLITPLWVNGVTGQTVQLPLGQMIERLIVAVLIPLALGQAFRLRTSLADFATRHKTPLGVIAQSLILTIVCTASLKAGARLNGGTGSPGFLSTTIVWGSCVGLHLVAMLIGWWGCRLWKFRREDSIAVAFASSQKTLPVGILIADMFSRVAPFAGFPMLMFHASQLFTDTLIASRLKPEPTTANGPASDQQKQTGKSDKAAGNPT